MVEFLSDKDSQALLGTGKHGGVLVRQRQGMKRRSMTRFVMDKMENF